MATGGYQQLSTQLPGAQRIAQKIAEAKHSKHLKAHMDRTPRRKIEGISGDLSVGKRQRIDLIRQGQSTGIGAELLGRESRYWLHSAFLPLVGIVDTPGLLSPVAVGAKTWRMPFFV
jgi:hypothetical protein